MRTLLLTALVLTLTACDSGTDTPMDDDDDGGAQAVLVGSYFGNGAAAEARDVGLTFRFGDAGLSLGTAEVFLGYNVLDGPGGSFDSGSGTARVTLGADGAFEFTCNGCTTDLVGTFPLAGSGTAERGRIELDIVGALTMDDLVFAPQ